MNPIDLTTARRLLDFSGGDDSLQGLAEVQIEGAVALQNMIADPEIGMAYLADEVGMGKTYIALGVVAMMRYFNPMLRVLYICPSRNVQEKWEREYKNFIRSNVRVSQGRIRTREGKPAAPYHSCRNVVEMIHTATSGYYTDFFIGKDSFSMGMTEEETVWENRRKELMKLLPAHKWKGVIKTKQEVKEQYARALNYILPTFDLVVIDEAHNFKHDFESSDRNKVLSRVLGFREGEGYLPRAKHSLLLSATPYDRDINQLRNQLNLMGRVDLLPDDIQSDDTETIKRYLRKFMVRRLNTLMVNKEPLTRNMYRREWRKGEKAEILLESDEQKLITALVQKKVGETLHRQHESPSFQMGLLASFESFAESTKSPPVEFDGEQAEKQQTDAKDRHVIGRLVDSYIESGLGRTLPHPKMDTVVKRLSRSIFEQGKKQIVFVRRVKSVKEIKDKLDDAYNQWIMGYIREDLANYGDLNTLFDRVYQEYLVASQTRDSDVSGGEIDIAEDEELEKLPPKNDTFFAWFFRGEPMAQVIRLLTEGEDSYPSPDAVRIGLGAKNQSIVNLLEPNWAWYLCLQDGHDLNALLDDSADEIATLAKWYVTGRIANDYQELYQACQIAFLEWYIKKFDANYLLPLFEHIKAIRVKKPVLDVTNERLIEQLTTCTLYTELEAANISYAIVPFQSRLYQALQSGNEVNSALRLFDIHKNLLSFSLRTGHGIIDIYLARLKQGAGNLTRQTRTQWIRDFVSTLDRQKNTVQFSTWHELIYLADHLELIIKNNIPDIIDLQAEEYRKYLSHSLNPVSPVIGATGETSGRSAQARKFRMPGYPLALISTDVFQEGEDLHTFCDSVVHYGISGSPVSLEQKTGRVDRVSSISHRRLTALERQAEEEDYIQVTFPYVKESIETLQLRMICHKINQFIESLHDVSAPTGKAEDNVNLDLEFKNRDEIPDQIMARLHSPYEPIVEEKNEYSAINFIEENEKQKNKNIQHLLLLVNEKIKKLDGVEGSHHLVDAEDMEILHNGMTIKITSAKASGELLLSLTKRPAEELFEFKNKNEIMKLMHIISWPTFHRTYAIEIPENKQGYQLFYNAEMLVEGESITQHNEIERIFERMEITHDPDSYNRELSEDVKILISTINDNTPIPVDRSGESKVRVDQVDGVSTLIFEFGATQAHRFQRVSLYECDGRCVFLSYAAPSGFCKSLSLKEMIKYTWLRNRNIDLVEFVIDPSQAIVGRVVHPLEEMQWDEFIYCAYTLAVEADNLEYVLDNIDKH